MSPAGNRSGYTGLPVAIQFFNSQGKNVIPAATEKMAAAAADDFSRESRRSPTTTLSPAACHRPERSTAMAPAAGTMAAVYLQPQASPAQAPPSQSQRLLGWNDHWRSARSIATAISIGSKSA